MENGEKRSNIEILKFKAEKLNRCKAVCLISHLVKWRALAPPPLSPAPLSYHLRKARVFESDPPPRWVTADAEIKGYLGASPGLSKVPSF